jgi:hypothetical protein
LKGDVLCHDAAANKDGSQMPSGFPALSATDLACIQAWADKVAAP